MNDASAATSTDAAEQTAAATARDLDIQRVQLHMPVDVRSVSLAVISFLAVLFALQWAKEVVIPILLGMMVSYALTPCVNLLQRLRVPRAAGAAFLLIAICGAIGWGAWSSSDQVNDFVDALPQVAQKIRQLTQHESGAVSTIEKVQQAATELEAAASDSALPASAASAPRVAAAARGPAVVVVPAPTRIDIRGYLLSGTLGALAFMGQVAVVFFLAMFMLASGSNFRRKMVRLAGPRLSQKKLTVETLDEIGAQIQRYLLVQLGISVVVGIASALAFYAIGLRQAMVWGVVAAVTNLVPYVGALVVTAGSTLVGLAQFGALGPALLVGASSLAIHTVIGNVLTPWWMGRASRLSPVAVFIAVLLFGWLWGVAGLLLGVPILLVVKSVCDRVEELRPIGEILGA